MSGIIKNIFSFCVFVAFAFELNADVKIEVNKEGSHSIDYKLIQEFFPDCYANNLHLYLKNKSIPIKIKQKNKLSFLEEGDKILFYAASMAVYRLSRETNIPPRRWKKMSEPISKLSQKKLFFRSRSWEKNKITVAFSRENVPVLSEIDHFMWAKADKKGSLEIEFEINDCANKQGKLSIDVVHSYTRETKGRARIYVNDVYVRTASVTSMVNIAVKNLKRGKNKLRLQLETGSYLPLYLNSIYLRYQAQCVRSGKMKATAKDVGRRLSLSKGNYFFLNSKYDYSFVRREFVIPSTGKFHYWEKSTIVAITKVSEWRINTSLKKQFNCNYLVIAPRYIRSELEPLLHKRKKQGHTIFVASPSEIYDTYGFGVDSAEAIADFIGHVHGNNSKKLEYVLLVGDAIKNEIPPHYIYTYFSGRTATDYPYVEKYSGLAIGRFPSTDKTEINNIVNKIISYEENSGEWQGKLHFVAGQGGFGAAIDNFSEFIFRQLMNYYMPKFYNISMTYANPESPYFYPANEFPQQILQRFEEGGLFLVYIGHGSWDCFAPIEWGKKRYPMFQKQHVLKIKTTTVSPIVVSIACSTSHFDHAKKSLGETMLLQQEGPIAFIGASRVSHPYANALFGKSMMKGMFHKRYQTIGKLMYHTKNELLHPPSFDFLQFTIDNAAKLFIGGGTSPDQDVERIRKEHMYLYNLLGDPATIVRYPKNTLSVKIQQQTDKFLTVIVKGDIPQNHAITLSLEKDLFVTVNATQESIKEKYEFANEKTVYTETHNNIKERYWNIPLKNIPHGKYNIRVITKNDKDCLLGATAWSYDSESN